MNPNTDPNGPAVPDGAAPSAAVGGVPAPGSPTLAIRLRRQRMLLWGLGGAIALALASLVLAWAGGYRYTPATRVASASTADPAVKGDLKQVERKLAALQPKGYYVVVDSAENRLRLMRHDEVVREAIASAGTGAVLVDESSGRTWVFETPRGVRKVLSRKKDPCWRRPDWDFVENGEPLPTRSADRIDCAALGKYALYLGDGYMIHGTLYERSLGMSVTHGCVRLGAADLEAIWKATTVGTKVYMY
jgi:L,D-transpeptidase YbiS